MEVSERTTMILWKLDAEKEEKDGRYELIRKFLQEELNENNAGKNILDVGSGLFSNKYIPEGYNVYNIDWIPQISNLENSYLCNCNNEKFPFKDGEIDVVISSQVYGYLSNPEKNFLDQTARVLKPGGMFILIDWEGNFKGKDLRIRNFEPETVSKNIEDKGFDIIKSVKLVERVIPYKDARLTAIVAKKNG